MRAPGGGASTTNDGAAEPLLPAATVNAYLGENSEPLLVVGNFHRRLNTPEENFPNELCPQRQRQRRGDPRRPRGTGTVREFTRTLETTVRKLTGLVGEFYARPGRGLELAVTSLMLTYGGGAVMFWLHAIYRGEQGPPIADVFHCSWTPASGASP